MKKQVGNKGVFRVKGGKMLFNRIGPMSGQVQKNRKERTTPVRKGIWVFPYPFFDMFFAYHQINRFLPKKHRSDSGNKILGIPAGERPDFTNLDDDGNEIRKLTVEEELELDKKAEEYWEAQEKIEKEYKKKFLKIKTIWWGGEIYSRIPPKSGMASEEWYLYTCPKEFLKAARKSIINKFDYIDSDGKKQVLVASAAGFTGIDKGIRMSVDHLECFLPTT